VKILIVSEDRQLEGLLRSVPAVERFSYEFVCSPQMDGLNVTAFQIIVLDHDNPTLISPEDVCAAKDAKTVVVGCFSADSFPVLAENYQLFHKVWIKPLEKEKVHASFLEIMNGLKEKEDALLTRKYLDTLIDSLPDLVWFKDAKGSHLKVNNSFCRVVNKSKRQIEGRGHYYIWDLEPDEYAQGEYVCLESEEVVLNKKETCLFDETVKCGDELRKFKTYKSPIFDTDGSVIGTVGFAHDVTDLQNLLIELNILIESLPFAIMITDKSRSVTSVNQRFMDMFTLDREDVIGKPIDILRDEIKRIAPDRNWKVEQENERILLLSEKSVLKVNEEKLLDIFGKLAGYIELFIDITLEHRVFEEKEKLKKAIEEIKQLSGLLPICASCKKIRDDRGYWKQIESYISAHSEAEFTHGMCPDCSEKLYGDKQWYQKMKTDQK
jgi:PAS domain S-box-containing protein